MAKRLGTAGEMPALLVILQKRLSKPRGVRVSEAIQCYSSTPRLSLAGANDQIERIVEKK